MFCCCFVRHKLGLFTIFCFIPVGYCNIKMISVTSEICGNIISGVLQQSSKSRKTGSSVKCCVTVTDEREQCCFVDESVVQFSP